MYYCLNFHLYQIESQTFLTLDDQYVCARGFWEESVFTLGKGRISTCELRKIQHIRTYFFV